MNHRVSDPFGGEKEQGKDRKSDLEALGIELFLCCGLQAPLGCRPVSQTANFPDNVKIDDRTEKCQSHHGDANGVLMEPTRRGVDACSGCEGG